MPVGTPVILGSSPLARGLLKGSPAHSPGTRIIPARAGSTTWGTVSTISEGGSSPLARGLHRDRDRRLRHPRIIPARAGSTEYCVQVVVRKTDHPRSRGVYALIRAPTWVAAGSSPLARGLRIIAVAHPRVAGIIPARAGST